MTPSYGRRMTSKLGKRMTSSYGRRVTSCYPSLTILDRMMTSYDPHQKRNVQVLWEKYGFWEKGVGGNKRGKRGEKGEKGGENGEKGGEKGVKVGKRGNNNFRVPIFCGSETMSGGLMLLFFSTVGASAGFQEALTAGGQILLFGIILLGTHLAIILGLGRLAKLPMKSVLVASNANVGGPATAAAMAGARNWPQMVRPALLTGTLGYTVGTVFGCLVGTQILEPIFR